MATNKRLIKSNDEGGGGASFNTVLYSGNSSTQDVTGVGFQPDMVWIKSRNINGANHVITDSVRGTGKFVLPNLTDGEYTSAAGTLSSFDSDGFSLSSPPPYYDFNVSGNNYVAWCWKAGGAAVTNNDGSVTSQVSANTEAGFSIVKTSFAQNQALFTVGHGLNEAPTLVIIKRTDAAEDWYVKYNVVDGSPDSMRLNTTAVSEAAYFTSTSTTISGIGITNAAHTTIAYCFAEVAGFSKFGSYVGNGSASGQTIEVGFEPAFVMIKKTSQAGEGWIMQDNKRGSTKILEADKSNAEADYGVNGITFNFNGFSIPNNYGQWNGSGQTYIYMAFSNQF